LLECFRQRLAIDARSPFALTVWTAWRKCQAIRGSNQLPESTQRHSRILGFSSPYGTQQKKDFSEKSAGIPF
jgi:hypothetical protein